MNYDNWLEEIRTEETIEEWKISKYCTEDFSCNIDEWVQFIDDVFTIRKNKHLNSELTNYLWHDAQACQLRFSGKFGIINKIPFKASYIIVKNSYSITEQWLNSPEYIPFTELSHAQNGNNNIKTMKIYVQYTICPTSRCTGDRVV